MKRRKSAFEKWFSLSRHQRRLGADTLGATLDLEDLQVLKERLVVATDGQERSYVHGSSRDLAKHMLRLRGEFVGQPELLYHHAQLIVLIRREADVRVNYERFEKLWLDEALFLSKNLDLRWLVSACDTFTDHAHDPVLRAVALCAVVLVNTIKLQETERFLQGTAASGKIEKPDALHAIRTRRVNLFDGLSAFIPGTDDTLRNMRWRFDAVCTLHPLGIVAQEIFERLQHQDHDNVYLRFRQRHTRSETFWW